MPQLCLLRHAKSSWKTPLAGDHERPLSAAGEAAAARIGAEMRRRGLGPDLVVCSTAARARATLTLVLEAMGLAPRILFDRRVYDADAEGLLGLVDEFRARTEQLLIVGHNTAIQIAASRLARHGNELALIVLETKFPAAGLAIIDYDAECWQDSTLNGGRLVDFVTPTTLKTG